MVPLNEIENTTHLCLDVKFWTWHPVKNRTLEAGEPESEMIIQTGEMTEHHVLGDHVSLKWILWWLVIDMIQSLACGMETDWNILTVIRLIVNKSSPRCSEDKSWWLWRSDPVCTGSLWPSAAQSSSFILNTECTHGHSLRPRSSGPVQDDTAPPPPRPFIIVIATHSEWSCWTAAFDLKLNSFMSVH